MIAVLKFGGSLSRGQGLIALGRENGRLAAQHRLLVVPGGGKFANAVRDHHRRYRISETTAHRMALLAMDQYGCLLGDLVPGSVLVTDLLSARRVAAGGQTPILLPSSLLIHVDPLPHSWQVTSDAIAAWVAGQMCAPRLILLKDVDGLFSADPAQNGRAQLLLQMTVEDLAGHRGGVDEYLATVLASVDLETWMINGQHPERLVELLQTGQTHGTRITRGPGNHPAAQRDEVAGR
ncbi:MAG: hypothetical protein HY871_02670 [Chloroflexi bacterium]|nr:hypothetical protein [Chloroflexota bacterium]